MFVSESSFDFARIVTTLGESTILLPMALAVIIALFLTGHRSLAFVWGLAVAGCAGTMLILKIIFVTCGHLILGAAIHTPSGHTAMAGVFYGAIALTIGLSVGRRSCIVLLTIAVMTAVVVALSRVVLHAHNPAEVTVGFFVGFAWLFAFALLPQNAHLLVRKPRLWMICGFVLMYGGLVATTLSGERVPVEGLIEQFATLLHLSAHVCAA